jgi:hypothetical protein
LIRRRPNSGRNTERLFFAFVLLWWSAPEADVGCLRLFPQAGDTPASTVLSTLQ